MKTNNIMKKLLKAELNAARMLHNAFDIDFEKNFNIYYLKGNYTINKIYNTIDQGVKNETIIILTRNKNNYNKDFHLVTIKNGAVNIEHKIYQYTRNIKKRVNIDYFFRKSDFETMRKAAETETYIIIQREELKTPAKKNDLDFNARYKNISKYSNTMGNGRGNSWIYRLFLKHLENNAPEIEYNINYYNIKSKNINDFIDKSGYLLERRRSELKRKAANLKAEREKAEYLKTENSAQIKELENIFKETKKRIIFDLEKSNDYKITQNIGRLLYFDFCRIEQDIKRFTEKTNSKDFASIEKSNEFYNNLKKRLFDTEQKRNNIISGNEE